MTGAIITMIGGRSDARWRRLGRGRAAATDVRAAGHPDPCLTICLRMTMVFIEATGMFLASGARAGRRAGAEDQ